MPLEDAEEILAALFWSGALGALCVAILGVWFVGTLKSMRKNLSKIANSANQQVLLLKQLEVRDSQLASKKKPQNHQQSRDVPDEQAKAKPEPVVSKNRSGYEKPERPVRKLSPKEVQAERANLLKNREKRDEN